MIVTDQLVDIGETLGIQAERLRIAGKMLKNKEPQEKIRKFTGVTKEELYKLNKELKSK